MTGTSLKTTPIRFAGNCEVPPEPSWRAFCRTVSVGVSIERSPPVIAQRNMSIVCIVDQFRKFPLQLPLQVAVEPAGCAL